MKSFEINKFSEIFTRRADVKLQEFYRAEKRHQKQQVLRQENTAEEDFLGVAQAAVQASANAIVQFGQQLSQYEQLTVEEIAVLQEKLDNLLAQREMLLENAYTLDDGMRVFKTEDGAQIFDEFGNSVEKEIVDPVSIGNDKTSWEEFSENNEQLSLVNAALQEKLEFLNELDGLREELAQDDLTEDQLNDLEKRLEAAIPESTRIRATALDAGDDIADPTADFSTAATNTIDLDSLKVTPFNPTNNLST